tara:strand:- start:8199 stop:9251 length:1053 start_codon:yes stop_codon:yes gene_type:complete
MDGVDASIIQSDGEVKYKVILDQYFEYPQDIYRTLIKLRDKIKDSSDIEKNQKQIKSIEKKITIFHADSAKKILKKTKINVDFIGFHGQTIFHNAKEKITKQLGDGKLLSKLTNKVVVFDFRQNDLKNGGEGAPLTPIFHQLLEKKFNIKPVSFFNIGGILNRTTILENGELSAKDEGPGMCLIDKWIRIKCKKKYDINGDIARSGRLNKNILDQYLNKIKVLNPNQKSYDTNDFDISLVKDLSLKDGAATLTYYTANILFSYFLTNKKIKIKEKIVLCGGGRKNKFLIDIIKNHNKEVKLIDEYGINGDFIESQAFAYLAIRSYLKLPISFPETTGVKYPCLGGKILKN